MQNMQMCLLHKTQGEHINSCSYSRYIFKVMIQQYFSDVIHLIQSLSLIFSHFFNTGNTVNRRSDVLEGNEGRRVAYIAWDEEE